MNSSSQLFTLSNKENLASERLIFFTGKGGVGKTLLSLAYTRSLKSRGLNVKHVSFKDVPPKDLIKSLEIPHEPLNLEASTLIYLELKLKSKQVSKWIASSSFFQAMFQMLPSLEDMVLLGHLIYNLNEDPSLIYVVDTPSSGHAFSLFESLELWKKIFISGPLIDDINMMKSLLQDHTKTKIFISSLMSELSMQEAKELKVFTENLGLNSHIILNDLYVQNEELKEINEELPDFLNHKISFEKEFLSKEEYDYIPHFFSETSSKIVESISDKVLNK